MSLVGRPFIKESVFIFRAIICAGAGFVFGSAFFDSTAQPIATYSKRLLFVIMCLSAAIVVGLITEYLLAKFRSPSTLVLAVGSVQRFRLSIERRFRGDRTDEEYRRAENGVVLLAIIASIIGMLFLIGVWVIVAIAIIFGMIAFMDIYISFKTAGRDPKAKVLRALASGVFYGLSFGFFFGPF